MKKIFTGILLFLCSFMIINAEELDFNVSSNKINKGDNLSIYIEPYDGNINVTYDKNIFEENVYYECMDLYMQVILKVHK